MTLTKIVSAGPETERHNLVIMVDRSGSASVTEPIARQFATTGLQGEAWWSKVSPAVNVWALTQFHDFHSRLPTSGDMTLLADYQDLLPFVRANGAPWAHSVGLGCNDVAAGHGSGGTDVFTFSTTGNDWVNHALHEYGHSHGLADEYHSASQTFVGPDPVAPNLTTNTDLATCKWRAFFPSTGGQIRKNPKPGDPLIALPFMSRTEVGLREGGLRFYNYGIFRPSDACKMGTSKTDPFCPVCQDAILRHLARWQPSPTVTPVPISDKRIIALYEPASMTYSNAELPASTNGLPALIHSMATNRIYQRRADTTVYDRVTPTDVA